MKRIQSIWCKPSSLILMFLLLGPGSIRTAWAYSWWECNDDPTKWESGQANTYQVMRCSIPQGSQRASDVLYSFDQWNAVYGMYDVFSWQWGTTECVGIDHGNGVNEIYFGVSDQMDGAWGTTYLRYDSSCDWWFSDQHIIESDVAINGETAFEWGSPACNSYAPPGSRTTVVHELGHALGLEHYDPVMNLMMTSDGEGKYCGNYVIEPHPDDAQGGRFLYSSGNSSTDLGASEHRLVASDDVDRNTTVGVTQLCPGQQHTFQWSVGNLGTVGKSYNVAWYLSTNTIISTSDIYVASNSGAYQSAGGFNTWSRTVTIPGTVTYGTEYYVGTFIDYDDQIGERYETNNKTYMARKIKIKSKSQCP